jgi:hypothetical protein
MSPDFKVRDHSAPQLEDNLMIDLNKAGRLGLENVVGCLAGDGS